MEGNVSRVTAITKGEQFKGKHVGDVYDNYEKLFKEDKGGSVEVRKDNYMDMVNTFYNMVTDIYEFGWGQSFHFAPRHKWESFEASIARSEMFMALKLGLSKGKVAIDIGCGVGGPGRTVARFSEANVVGLNNNEYQLTRCKKITEQQGLSHLCSYMKADFQSIPVSDNTYDAAFHFEALEHSPDRVAMFKEILRILKPGGLLAGYDWVITDKCDLNNAEHVRIKKSIELGNGLPDLERPGDIIDSMKKAGFEIIEHYDLYAKFDSNYEIPWYDSLEGKYWSFANFKHTPWGMWLTNKMVWTLETLKIAPSGTLKIHNMLVAVAKDLVAGGKTGTFSPDYFYLARKPTK